MDTPFILRLALLVSASLYPITGEASPFGPFPVAEVNRLPTFELADPRSYHHCHNLPRRVYCHKQGVLPGTWAPNTNTPRSQHLHRVKPPASTISRSYTPRG
jgi:hypothetical protein